MYACVCFDVCLFLSFLELIVLLLTDTKPDLFSQLEGGGGGGTFNCILVKNLGM